MESRNLHIRQLSWMSSLLLLIVIILANAVFARSSTRIDLTEEGRYTLTDGSRRILGDLEDPAVVKVFWHDIPARFNPTKRYLEALLDEMENAVGGDRFQVQWVDMEEEEGKTAASELGVEQYLFGAQHGSEVRESKGYMSLTIELGNEKPAVFNALSGIQDQLEYLVVAEIYKRSRTERPVIGMVAQRPQFNPFAGGRQQGRFGGFGSGLRQTYGSAARDYLTLDQPIDPDVEVLIVVSPRGLDEKKAYHLEQFLLRGGRVILLLDPVDIENVFGAGSQRAEPHLSGLEDWLAHVGVTAERGVVGDFEVMGRIPRGRFNFHRYPFFPIVVPAFMDRENPVTRNLVPMPLYWPAALSVDGALQEAEGRTATVLATTTENGYRRGDITGLREARDGPEGKALEKVPLIVLVEGPLKSFWLGKPIPGTEPEPTEGAGGDGDADAPGADDEPESDEPKKDEPKKDEPKKDEPKKDEPKKDEPKKDDGSDGDGEADAKEDEEEDEEEGPKRLEDGQIRLLIVGDAEMISDQLGPRSQLGQINGFAGYTFVANAAEWLSGSEDLLSLRARATNPRKLEPLEENDRDLIKLLNLLAVPLLVLLAGITVFIVRRS